MGAQFVCVRMPRLDPPHWSPLYFFRLLSSRHCLYVNGACSKGCCWRRRLGGGRRRPKSLRRAKERNTQLNLELRPRHQIHRCSTSDQRSHQSRPIMILSILPPSVKSKPHWPAYNWFVRRDECRAIWDGNQENEIILLKRRRDHFTT